MSSSVNESLRETGGTDAGDFECNICFELAEDPIVTLCGHLFCWPCLYKWLNIHSQSHECPVCKAVIHEQKLIPLYGRGKTQTDPRAKPVHGFDNDIDIPHRPAGQRPATAPPPDSNTFPNSMFGGFGVGPTASARFGNFAFSSGIGGLFPSLADMNVHGFQNPLQYGPRHAYGPRFGFHGGHHVHEYFHPRRGSQENNLVKTFLLMFGIFFVLVMIM
ncbi:uncharacterized protein LOC143532068 [Bidens hawaiensis]|uniref:uncharacterized protein LOC143532068 n=1 Tax=Bidens hawaiensis TaxID=980011 RepID=UPI004049DCDB